MITRAIIALTFFVTINVTAQENINLEMLEWAEEGNLEEVMKYMDKGADVNYIDKTHRNAGVYALWNAEEDEGELFHYLASKGLNLKFLNPSEGNYLHIAAKYHAPFLFKELLEAGIDINERNNNDETPLLISASLGDLESVKELISLGADITLPDKDDRFYFELMDLRDEDAWNMVLNSNLSQKQLDLLMRIAIDEHESVDHMKQTIEKGANVNQEFHEVSLLTYFKNALEDADSDTRKEINDLINYLKSKGAR